jgi:methylenetetrahydrofolate--tRNA-(uracil-5-)-methyltransferase
MKYADQVKVFRTIPGLEKAEFARLGGLHRNTFLNSPRVLDEQLRLKADPRLRFAGQVTGVEGYVESAAMGLMAGRMAVAEIRGEAFTSPPPTTAHGALINHITGGHIETTDAGGSSFQPMNVNFGLFPPIAKIKVLDGKRLKHPEQAVARKRAYTSRAMADFDAWLGNPQAQAAE